MINVISLYSDRSGCGDYRVRFPADAINAQEDELGVHVEVADHLNGDATFVDGNYHIRRIDVPNGVDVVLFQRPTMAAVAGTIRWLKEFRPDIGIVVELDDDLANVPVTNEAYWAMQPGPANLSGNVENFRWLHRSIALCDVLTVSTPPLATRYNGPHNHTHVIRNAVPASMLDQPARTLSRRRSHVELNDDRVIGWAGSVGSHGGDLEVTHGAMQSFIGAERSAGGEITFRNIGPRAGVASALGLAESDVEASGWLSTSMYRLALSELDIGIVPLAGSKFNLAKSSLKALEFAAAGVPVIASNLPEHQLLQQAGLPLLLAGDRQRHWRGALHRYLALDDKELKQVAVQGREYIRRYATMSVRAPEWAAAFQDAAEIARRRTERGARRVPA